MNVGKDAYTLADIKITTVGAAADRNNYIVFWAAGSTIKVDKERAYWFDSTTGNWRIRNGATKSKDGTVEDPTAILINPGEGFLCNFGQATTTITYSGEVLKGVDKKLVITRPEGIQNFSACNVAGKEITLADISIKTVGAAADRNNYIVFMAAGSTIKVDKERAYWFDSTTGNWRIRNGATKSKDGTVEDPSAIKIAAGEGFLCNFGQADTTLTLPTAL